MRLFSICPRVRKRGGCIVAVTAWRIRLLFLGALYRKTIIDPRNRVISIRSRYLWLISRERQVPFSDIQAVTYGYEDMSTDLLSYAHDTFDWFSVGLRLRDDSEVRLFNFIGDGTFQNDGPWPDWMYWDEFIFDSSGSQERESRAFVDVLSTIVGVQVVPPRNY